MYVILISIKILFQYSVYFTINYYESKIAKKFIDTISAKYKEYCKKAIVQLKNIKERKAIENTIETNLKEETK